MDEATTGAIAQKSPSETNASASETAQIEGQSDQDPQKGPVPYDRFSEVVQEKNTFKAELEELKASQQDLLKRFEEGSQKSEEAQTEQVDKYLQLGEKYFQTEEDRQIFRKLFPAMKDAIFTQAAEAEEARIANETKQQEEARKAEEKAEQQTQQVVKEIEDKLGSKEKVAEFGTYLKGFLDKFPKLQDALDNDDLRRLADDFLEQDSSNSTSIGKPSQSGRPDNTKPVPIDPNDDTVTHALKAWRNKFN